MLQHRGRSTQGRRRRDTAGTAVVASAALLIGTLAVPGVAAATTTSAAVTADQPQAVVAERSDAVTAQMAARNQGTRVEVTGARSATGRLWAEPDGSFTQETYDGPNWTLDAAGNWVEIDTRLARNGDGTIGPKAAAMQVTLAGPRDSGAKDTALVQVAVPQAALPALAAARTDTDAPIPATTTAGPTPASVTVGFDGALPAPELVDNQARYRDVAPSRDLRVVVLPSGVETFVDLTARPEKIPADGLEVSMPLALDGLSVKEDGKGGLLILDPATGDVVGTSPAARIWDATAHEVTGDPLNTLTVDTRLRRTEQGWDVVATIPASFFDTKGLTYPVTVDPLVTLSPAADTFVQSGSDAGTNFESLGHLNVGTYDAGSHVARAYLSFTLGYTAGLLTPDTIVDSAKLKVWEYDANSCTPSDMYIRRLTSAPNPTTVTWNTKPTQSASIYTVTDARIAGSGGACTESWIDTTSGTDVKTIVQDWADGTATNYGFALTASETSSTGWKRFYSNDTSTIAKRPSLVINFHHRPGTPPKVAIAGRNPAGWIRDTTPTLQFHVNDGDGGEVTGHFAISTVSTFSSTTWSDTSPAMAGTLATSTPTTALSQGTQYYARVRASQASPVSPFPTEYSNGTTANPSYPGYSAHLAFKIDTVVPTVTVSCSALPENGLTNPAPSTDPTCNVTASDTTSGVSTYAATLDSDTAGVSVAASGSPRAITVDKDFLLEGTHDLTVTVTDAAGNAKVVNYRFGIGSKFLSEPSPGLSTSDGSIVVQATADAGASSFFEYSTDKSTWTTIPGGDLKTSTGGSVTTPVALTTSGLWKVTDKLVWTMPLTSFPTDGVIFVRPCVVPSGGGTCTTGSSTPVTLDRSGAGAAQTSVGPVSVALTTGAASFGAADASVGPLSVGRSYNSFSPSTAGPFGLGWTTSLSAGSGWTRLVDDAAAVRVYAGAGDPIGFTKDGTSAACPSGKYKAPADETSMTLCKVSSSSFTLKEGTFQKTTFAQQGSSTTFLTSSVEDLQTGQLVVLDADTNGVTRIVAPLPSGLTASTNCPVGSPSTWARACQDVQISYSSGRVSTITWRGWEQPLSGGAAIARSYDVACYRYDGTGHVTQVWDPRDNLSGYAACGTGSAPTGALVTAYGYDGNGRLNSITPGALKPWSIGYDANGRVTTVSRTHGAGYNSGATETTTIQYGVNIGAASSSSDDTHPDLTTAAVATWWPVDPAQYPVVAPVTATAVFPPGASTATLHEATVTAMDDLGAAVMTANFSGTLQAGWRIATQVLDPDTAMTVASLTPANRAAALDAASEARVKLNLDGTSAEAAQMLSTQTVTTNLVDDDGDLVVNGDDIPDVTDTYGPLHMIDVDGDLVAARTHVHTTYGDVDPATDPSTLTSGDRESRAFRHTPLAVTEAGWDPSTQADIAATVETTSYAYAYTAGGVQHTAGWKFSTPVQTTIDVPTGTDIVKRVVLDTTTGAVIQLRQPSAANDNITYVAGVAQASNPGTYLTSTWKDGTYNAATCTSSVWYGLPCLAKPASGSVPAATQTYYDVFGRAVKKVDTGAGSTTRTSQITYGNSGLSSRTATSTISGGATGDKAVLDKTFAYSSTTGLPTGVTAGTGGGAVTTTTSYDDFARPLVNDDGYQGVVTVTYENTTGRLSTVARTQNGTAVGTSTYTYNGGTEKRGLPTSVAQTTLGTVTATYDADGAPITQVAPMASGTLTATWSRNTAGQATELRWTRSGASQPLWLTSTNDFDAHGRVASDSTNLYANGGRTVDYTYDGAGRLTKVNDTREAQCVSRTYGFDTNSNRTSLKAYDPTSTGSCQTSTASSTTNSAYSTADQPTATGLTYDDFGRTMALPTSMTADPASTNFSIGYHANDLVASTLVTPSGSAAQRQEWTLDASDRLACRRDRPNATTDSTSCGSTVTSGVTDTTNHYQGGGDSPTWTVTRTGASTPTSTTAWYAPGLVGGLLATVAGGTVTISLANLHGDIPITTTATQAANPDGTPVDADEYGVVKDASGSATTGPRYAWLGTAQRDATTANGLTLMGVRLYNPVTGQFLSTDPVRGGNPGSYSYPADPVNGYDLSGQYAVWGYKWVRGVEFLGWKYAYNDWNYVLLQGWVNRRTSTRMIEQIVAFNIQVTVIGIGGQVTIKGGGIENRRIYGDTESYRQLLWLPLGNWGNWWQLSVDISPFRRGRIQPGTALFVSINPLAIVWRLKWTIVGYR